MIKLSDIFLKNLPTLDLHGTQRDIALVLAKDFIEENYILKKEKIVIIHGIGLGIIKKIVHEELKNNRKIKDFHIDPYNSGITVITLNIQNS